MLQVELLRLFDDLLVLALDILKSLICFLIDCCKLWLILLIDRLLQLHHILLEHLLRSWWLGSLLAVSRRMQVRIWLLLHRLLLLFLNARFSWFALDRFRAGNLGILAVEVLIGWLNVCLLQSCSGRGFRRVISSQHLSGLLLHGSCGSVSWRFLVDDGSWRNVLFFFSGRLLILTLHFWLSRFGLASAPHSCLFGSSICTLLSLRSLGGRDLRIF